MDIDQFTEFIGHRLFTQNCLISLSEIQTYSKFTYHQIMDIYLLLSILLNRSKAHLPYTILY